MEGSAGQRDSAHVQALQLRVEQAAGRRRGDGAPGYSGLLVGDRRHPQAEPHAPRLVCVAGHGGRSDCGGDRALRC